MQTQIKQDIMNFVLLFTPGNEVVILSTIDTSKSLIALTAG